MHIFAQAFPERFFQIGMAEQLLLGAAAGFAEAGLIPFASTYSVFADPPRRTTSSASTPPSPASTSTSSADSRA